MAEKASAPEETQTRARRRRAPFQRLSIWRGLRWFGLRVLLLMLALVGFYGLINPPTTWTIAREATFPREWTDLEEMTPALPRAVVAAEDANFCLHWGFDMAEIRKVIASNSSRGASTLTQQTAKNVYLWQGRSWVRKLLETAYTPMIEALWTKRRILEVYLNVAEFGPGVFGVHAAAAYHFGTTPDALSPTQAARRGAILPAPKTRGTAQGSRRSRAIADGAETIRRDGRAACFE